MSVILKPISVHFIVENCKLINCLLIGCLLTGYENYYVMVISCIITSFIFLWLCIKWLKMRSISWTVSSEQIKYKRGILAKRTDYLELYRVIDFNEHQSFLQRITGTKTITIYSGDKSNPRLNIFGQPDSSDITDTIRNLVEKQKENKHIYEITNR